MSENPYQANEYRYPQFAIQASATSRMAFIRSTYLHLLGAVLAFVFIDATIIGVFGQQLEPLVKTVLSGYYWLGVLAAFMAVSWIANRWALSDTSREMQYAGLSLYVVAEAIIFVPLLYVAERYCPGAIQSAGLVTLLVFGGLTAGVFITRTDFSFIGPALSIFGFAAIAFIVASIIFQMPMLGTWFSIAMVVLASGYILYSTSNILHHYRTDQPVAAALALFASVALLFWYVLQIFMSRD